MKIGLNGNIFDKYLRRIGFDNNTVYDIIIQQVHKPIAKFIL